MKIKVENIANIHEKIFMKTSMRSGMYSIHFHRLNSADEMPVFWGHLNKRQMKKMKNELELFINRMTDLRFK